MKGVNNKRFELIYDYIEQKEEKIFFELIIKNYNNTNFYMAIVFNKEIEKFKVIFVPVDLMDKGNVEDYICFQFIGVQFVNCLLQSLKNVKRKFSKDEKRDRLNKNITNFYIELSVNINDKYYTFKTTKYIPAEWSYLFDPIVILFEHVPTIMNGLCHEILSVLTNSTDPIEYGASVDFDLFNDDLEILFTPSQMKKGQKYYEENEIVFLEKVEGKYFAIVKNHIIVIEYNDHSKIMNTFCDCSPHVHGRHIYSVIKAIRDKKLKRFYKLMVVDNKKEFEYDKPRGVYYLCYGFDNGNFKVIKAAEEELLPIKLYKKGRIKIIEDNNNSLLDKINQEMKNAKSK